MEEVDAQLECTPTLSSGKFTNAGKTSGYVNDNKYDRTPCAALATFGVRIGLNPDTLPRISPPHPPTTLQCGIVIKLVPGTLDKPRLATRIHVPVLLAARPLG